jgi:hypothetical protein
VQHHCRRRSAVLPVGVRWLALPLLALGRLEAPERVQMPPRRTWLAVHRRSCAVLASVRVARLRQKRVAGGGGHGQIVEDVVLEVFVGHVGGAVAGGVGAKREQLSSRACGRGPLGALWRLALSRRFISQAETMSGRVREAQGQQRITCSVCGRDEGVVLADAGEKNSRQR